SSSLLSAFPQIAASVQVQVPWWPGAARARKSCKHRRSQGRPRCKPPLHKFTGSNVQGRTVVPPLRRCSFFHIHKHLLIAIHCTLIAP
ncbi:hypothetical protein CCUS01_01577, partial [Colletotrichum cuscutae]